jgi:hypothetical protein
MLCFSFLFAGIFRFAPSCHNSSPSLSISARDAFVDLSLVPRDTRTGHEWREPLTNERVL